MTTLTSVPGQFSTGYIDGFYRDNPADGTLGTPDNSPVPYTYVPLLENAGGLTQWAVGPFNSSQVSGWGGFKGSPDGLGAVRNVGANSGSARITVIPQATGVPLPPGNARTPDSLWAPRDFAFALRHDGTTGWTVGYQIRAYLRFTQVSNSAQIWITQGNSTGPWDAAPSDQPAITLPTGLNVWDGNSHSFSISQAGSLIFCLVDGLWPLIFNAPIAWRRLGGGTMINATVPATGPYMGFDCRGTSAALWAWEALAPATADAFYWNPTVGTLSPPPSGTYTPATAASGEAWTCSGSVTASSSGVSLGASSSMLLTPANAAPNAIVATRFNSVASAGGLVLKRKDANNYLLLTPTRLLVFNNGSGLAFPNFPSAIPADTNVEVALHPTVCSVYINGVSTGTAYTYAGLNVASASANQIGFLSPTGATSTFRYLAYQPQYTTPVLPTI